MLIDKPMVKIVTKGKTTGREPLRHMPLSGLMLRTMSACFATFGCYLLVLHLVPHGHLRHFLVAMSNSFK